MSTKGFTLVTHGAALGVPRHVVDHLSRLLAAQVPDLHEVLGHG
ncbi:hypothetical protein [Streptomyces sp. NWU49]|nr:hypothetical protein [Streptomyces sp. NWU49]